VSNVEHVTFFQIMGRRTISDGPIVLGAIYFIFVTLKKAVMHGV
jgi:hypothetical protein